MRVSVRDFGTGLPVEEPERIFERFFSTKREGMGMGLAIARSIIASHEGELAAANAEGSGACVYFSLPVIAGALRRESAAARRSCGKSRAAGKAHAARV